MDTTTPQAGSDLNKKINQVSGHAKDSLKNTGKKTRDAVHLAADATSKAM